MGAVDDDQCLYIRKKMGKFVLFGAIQPHTRRWTGTKVHVKTGLIGPREYSLPGDILSVFIDKANRYGDIGATVSET